ncbi:MAG: hypothetical protein WA957_14345, partial [Alteraurantiacibacter sp.]
RCVTAGAQRASTASCTAYRTRLSGHFPVEREQVAECGIALPICGQGSHDVLLSIAMRAQRSFMDAQRIGTTVLTIFLQEPGTG